MATASRSLDRAASPVRMDFDGDGYLEPTAWAAPDDGVLVLDLAADGGFGPDGKLSNVMEIAFSRWWDGATTDLEGLRKAFDLRTGNDELDAADPHFADFRIWQDKDKDGKVGAGE